MNLEEGNGFMILSDRQSYPIKARLRIEKKRLTEELNNGL